MLNGARRDSVVRALLRRTRFPLLALGLLSLATNLLVLTGPLFMLQVYDRVLASRSVPTLVALFALVAGTYAFLALLELLRARMASRFAGALEASIAPEIFRASLRAGQSPLGLARPDAVRDLDSIRSYLGGSGPLALFDLPWLPVYLAIVFLFHPALGWLATGGALVATTLLVINERLSGRPTADASAAMAQRQALGEDALGNAEPIFAMGMLDDVTNRWQARAASLAEVQSRASDVAALYASVTKSFRFLLQSAVLALGAYLVIRGELSAGLMIAASIVTSRALAPVEQVVAQWRGLAAARQALRRTEALLAARPPESNRLSLPDPQVTLEVRHFATGPDARQPPLVAGASFTLAAGEAMGVLGLSGSGKTSLARGLCGIWPALQGEVRLDGSEFTHFDPVQLGRRIGYLPQSVGLFDGTVAENIARFRPDADSDSVLKAAHHAGVHELIAGLPDGYDTRIGARGAALSAGQRQRIGLARALYGDPFLLVLDEPNANLDFAGDNALTMALTAAKARGAVVIVIAHRPSAIAVCDKLIYLVNGRQSAFGAKEEVLRQVTAPSPRIEGARVNG
ncbi:MAG TPA: type I secretion system permease/ATPase [Devosia sp.]|jgi:ATP-binding cassette subfamily C protein PrsD|uniref:type I secretion system permease/ATPase n=1 Tax=Devosia sp. TaxID=1871048 RepID=UPI002DDDAA7E|nr:type I secretion system permease/ATPase [Devosia sp.]HEV2516206.1 type I secretion system permease/ATPase [Devosia sp.]